MNEEIKATEQEAEVACELVEIIGINFREAGKIYYFAPGDFKLTVGEVEITPPATLEVLELELLNLGTPLAVEEICIVGKRDNCNCKVYV